MCSYDCRDGLIFTRDSKGYERLYRCPCELGDKYNHSLFSPSDKTKEKPIELPVYGKKKSMVVGRELAAGKDDE